MFGQGLHATELYDYAVGKVKVRGQAGGRAADGQLDWTTRVEVVRKEEGRIPVEVAVIAERDTGVVRVEGLAEREWVEVPTRSKPKRVVLDPRVRTHDWNMLNNRKRIGGFLTQLFGSAPGGRSTTSIRTSPPGPGGIGSPSAGSRRCGTTTPAASPSASRSQSDYLGRFEQNQVLLSVAHRLGSR